MTEPLLTASPGGVATHDLDFERFYARWHPAVLRWAQAKYGATNADEIAQETLSRAFINFRQLRQDLPWPWLLTVARNVACDLHRSTARCFGQPAYDGERPDPNPGPEELALRAELTAHVRAAMSAMPVGDRELLSMSAHDMSIAEMADKLGTSHGAVRVRLHRARKRLGHVYLAHRGNLAVTPLGAVLWALRKMRRGMQQAVPAAAPTTALLAATATVATIGAVISAVPSIALHRSDIHQSADHTRTVATSSAPEKAHADITTRKPAAATRVGHEAQASLVSATTPTGVQTSANLGAHPRRPGKAEDHSIRVPTPVGTVVLKGVDLRTQGSGVACRTVGLVC